MEINESGRETSTEEAIAALFGVVLNLGESLDHRWDFDLQKELTEALEKMATHPDLQYQVGVKALQSDAHRSWGMAMLAKSGREEAFEELVKWLSYDTGEGSDHWGHLMGVATEAVEPLNVMVGTNSELQYKVGCGALKSPWLSIQIWAIEMLAKSRLPEAIQMLATPKVMDVRRRIAAGDPTDDITTAVQIS